MNSYSNRSRRGIFAKRQFSILVFFICALCSPSLSHALDVVSLYTASCEQKTGVIVDVDNQSITLITLDGKTQTIMRYEVIYYASYSVDSLPTRQLTSSQAPPYLVVSTRQNGEMHNLVAGWPIDFTESRIGFLTLNGGDAVIDRSDIWQIETHIGSLEENTIASASKNNSASARIELIPPYPFAQCPVVVLNEGTVESKRGTFKVPPQQLLSDPIAIKTEFDRLMRGHAQIGFYIHRQEFYAVPFVFGNRSSLGLWTSIGARHATSQNRTNNFTPLLIDERGRGPFSFQQQSITGVGPLPQGFHEEPQSQVSYALKSSYVHFTAMLDPELFLVGNRYLWTSPDFSNSTEDRVAQTGQFSLGVGVRRMVFSVYSSTAETGIKAPGLFDRQSVGIAMIGLSLQWPTLKFEILGGSGIQSSVSVSLARGNIEWSPDEHTHWLLSILQRQVQDSPSTGNLASFAYTGNTETIALYGVKRIARRFDGGAFLSVENTQSSYGQTSTSTSISAVYPKGGIYAAIEF